MDYISLMNGRDKLGKGSLVFSAYEKAGEVNLLAEGQYTFLLVLQGSVRCYFRGAVYLVRAGKMLAFDKDQLQQCTCDENTVIMEYVPLAKMFKYMKLFTESFHAPYSDLVPFDERVHEWCQWLIDRMKVCCQYNKRAYYKLCGVFAKMMLQYSPGILGNLYIPLYACQMHRGGCEECAMGCKVITS
ncbi:MAG: hypothetical protein GY706_10515 [Bacteroides sp.]|nr:hypothetical protein [Bacteroides sp.]